MGKEKKEIGMEKLIELLDKFRKNNKRELFGEPGTLVPLTGKDFIELNRLIIISKEYGFIKWLVENDKIDRDISINGEGHYESLLMKLSIQDEPIRFLCEIIK